MGVGLHPFLALELDEMNGQLHTPAALPLGQIPPIIIEKGWVDPTAGSDTSWAVQPVV
jgi:hypothetical protein